MIAARTLLCLLLLAPVAVVAEETSGPVGSGDAAQPPATQPARIEHDGQAFELARSSNDRNVLTDEYLISGETLADWTQLVTVQRLKQPTPARIDAFLAYFSKRVAGDGATFQVLKETASAGVFVVRFPKSDTNEEQVMICLVLAGSGEKPHLDIVQYAIKPTRLPVDVVEMRIKSWRDRFLGQVSPRAP